MTKTIVLDSAPLGLILQRPGIAAADGCRRWFQSHAKSGVRFFVPEIVEYELRRELLRLNLVASLSGLDGFLGSNAGERLILTSADLRLAAELWARARMAGKPTAHPHALDVDVILSAQVINAGIGPPDPIVATSNISHLSQFVDARDWATI